MRTVRFTTVAEREMMDAAIYLEVRRTNFGRMFLNRIDRTLELLLQFPASGAPVEGTVLRKHNVRGFQYKLVYAVTKATVWIVAVAHHRRDWDDWRYRNAPEGEA